MKKALKQSLAIREAEMELMRSGTDVDPDAFRRNMFKLYYTELLSNQSDIIDISKILASLHDTWSEIRKDSSKSLAKLGDNIPLETSIVLLDRLLENVSVGIPWQISHGSLLGIGALSKTICKHDVSRMVTIRQVCMTMLSNNRMPIREASSTCIRNCLLSSTTLDESITKWNEFYTSMLELAKSSVKHDVDNLCEENTLELDGVLGCIRDTRAELRVGNAISATSPAPCLVTLDRALLLEVLHLCLGHPSSTVRQRAAGVLSLVCVPLLARGEGECTGEEDATLQACIDDIVSTLSAHAKGRECERAGWWQIEGALLVADEMLAALVGSCVISLEMPIVFRPLTTALQFHMADLLADDVFEVRRACSQLVPSLARLCVLTTLKGADSDTGSLLWPHCALFSEHCIGGDLPANAPDVGATQEASQDHTRLPPTPPVCENGQGGEGVSSSDSFSRTRRARVCSGWTAELLKCAYTMLSIWCYDRDGEEGHKSIWSNFHVPRRLGEADRQRHFTLVLSAVKEKEGGDVHRTGLQNRVVLWLRRHCVEFSLWLDWCASVVFREGSVLCPDFIEAGALLSLWKSRQQQQQQQGSPLWLSSWACLYLSHQSVSMECLSPETTLLREVVERCCCDQLTGRESESFYSGFRAESSVFDPAGVKSNLTSMKCILADLADFLLPLVSNIVFAIPPDSPSSSRAPAIEGVVDSVVLGALAAVLLAEFSPKLSSWRAHFEGALVQWLSSTPLEELHIAPSSTCGKNGEEEGVSDKGDLSAQSWHYVRTLYGAVSCLLQCTWRGVKSFLDSKDFLQNFRTISAADDMYALMWQSLQLALKLAKVVEALECEYSSTSQFNSRAEPLYSWRDVVSGVVCYSRDFAAKASELVAVGTSGGEGLAAAPGGRDGSDDDRDDDDEFSDWDDEEEDARGGDVVGTVGGASWKELSEDVVVLLSKYGVVEMQRKI
jgi:hypothetical protein